MSELMLVQGKETPSSGVTTPSSDPRDAMLHKPREVIYGSPAKGRITLVMQRAYNLMLKVAAQQGLHKDWYEIPTSQLARDLEYNSHDMAFLEESLDRMQTTLVKWEVRDPKTHQLIKTSVQLMGKVQFVAEMSESGACLQKIIRFRFDEDIKQRLLNPETFAVLDTALLNRFTTRYALALYEILMFTFRNNPVHDDGWTYSVSSKWEEWRDILIGEAGATSSHFTQFKYFNRDVILKALKNIKAVAPEIEADCIPIKSGRFITHLQFKVKLAAQSSFDLEDTLPPIDTSAIVERLRALGIPHNVIQRMLRKHALEELESAASYTELRLKRKDEVGVVDNIAGYFTMVVNKRYWEADSKAAEHIIDVAKNATPALSSGSSASKSVKQPKDPFTLLGEQHFNALAPEEQKASLNDFIVGEASPALIAEYRKNGLSTLMKKTYFNWLGKQLTAP